MTTYTWTIATSGINVVHRHCTDGRGNQQGADITGMVQIEDQKAPKTKTGVPW